MRRKERYRRNIISEAAIGPAGRYFPLHSRYADALQAATSAIDVR